MTDDLKTRMKSKIYDGGYYSEWWLEAFDRIEQLEAALRKIKQSDTCGCQSECIEMCKIAEAALGNKKDDNP